jgi:hypothetical protein
MAFCHHYLSFDVHLHVLILYYVPSSHEGYSLQLWYIFKQISERDVNLFRQIASL